MTPEDIVALLLSGSEVDDPDPDGLFDGGKPTDLALHLYLEGALSAEGMSRVSDAVEQNVGVAARLARVSERAAARKDAFLLRLLGDRAAPESGLVLEVDAKTMGLLFEPRLLVLAASEVRGGTVQTHDRKALVTLAVTEKLAEGSPEGTLLVKIQTHRDARLVDVDGHFDVMIRGEPYARFPVEVRNRKFEKAFPFERLAVPSEDVRFRLFLSMEDA